MVRHSFPKALTAIAPNIDCVDTMLTSMLTSSPMATAIDSRLSLLSDKQNVDLVDPVDQFLEQEHKQKDLEQPEHSSPLVEVTPDPSITLNNSQQSQHS